MVATYTTNTHLELQATGDNSGTWGSELNTAVFTILDNVLGNVQTISLASTDVTLNTAQTQVNFIKLTGTLTADVNVIFPAIGRTYFIRNSTTGSHTVTLKIGAGATALLPQGTGRFFVLDGTNVLAGSQGEFGQQTSVAAATTTSLSFVSSNNINVTGSAVSVTSFGVSGPPTSPVYLLTFAGSVTLTNGAALLLPGAVNITTSAGATALVIDNGSNNWQVLGYTPALPAPFPIFGGGRLTFTSSTVVTYVPYQGNLVTFPSGVTAVIPSAGISSTINNAYVNGASGQTLTAGVLQYAYLWNSGTATAPVWVIDWSTTGHSTDGASGIEIKTGSASRVLIGMAYPQAGPVFSDSTGWRGVASWFNRKPKQVANAFTTNRSASTGGFAEINSEIRCEFLSWGDSATGFFAGSITVSGGGQNIFTGVSLDGSTTAASFFATQNYTPSGATQGNASVGGTVAPSEGAHYFTVLGYVSGGTGSWIAGSGQGQLTGTVIN